MKKRSILAVTNVIKELNSGAYANEASKRDLFNLELLNIFCDVDNKRKLYEFAKGSERNIKVTTNEGEVNQGFQDVDLGTMTIEWKKDLKIEKNKITGQKELREYTSGKWNKNGYSENYKGILTDGSTWIAYSTQCKQKKNIYNENDVELIKIESIEAIDENDAEYLYKFLYKYIITENRLIINPNVLQQIFGENNNINKECRKEIKILIEKAIKNDPEIGEYIRMWNIYKQYNINITNEESLEIYAQNIYLVLLARILVAMLMEMNKCKINDEWIKKVINGESFRNDFKITNFVQQDIYYWILGQEYIDEFIRIAKKLYYEISEYDFINTNKDNLLHLIYEEITPKKHRKKYGQKSTDFRLCDSIIDRLNEEIQIGKKYIEPAVGSGSIERSLFIKLKDKMDQAGISNEEKLERLQKDVIGIDIDPIAIILAKSEWIITNTDLIKQSKKVIEIPIYHADSLFHNSYTGEKLEELKIILESNKSIILEKNIIRDITTFNRYLTDCDKLASFLFENNQINEITDNDVQFINKYIKKDIDSNLESFRDSTKELCKYFVRKRRVINNGIWKELLFNNNIPQLLFKSFDIVIGNLPWLALSSLPNVEYTQELKDLCAYYKISATGSSHHHQEIATVFALRCIDKFLNNNGLAAYVMPGTIVSGDHHMLFREKKFKEVVNVEFYELWDIPNEINPFNVKSCVLFMRKNKINEDFKMRKLNTLDKWDDTTTNNIKLISVNKKNTWAINKDNNISINDYYFNKFQQGADLMPRTAVFINTEDNIEEYDDDDDVSIRTADYAQNNKNAKKLKGRLFNGVIKRKYIFTTIISEMLLPYYICNYKSRIALPIDIKTDDKNSIEKIHFVYDKDFIQSGDELSARWFNQFDELPEFETKKFREYLNERNKLLDQSYFNAKYLVHMGASGECPCAAVHKVEKDFKFIADQTTYVAEIDNEDEAYYIVAILNSQYINKIIKDFQSEGGFAKRHIHKIPFNFIPKYNYKNIKHKEIAELSKKLSKEIIDTIEENEFSINKSLGSRRNKLKEIYKEKIQEIEILIIELYKC